jgi:hypothetical protein
MAVLTRACGRAGCPRQGVWASEECCPSCGFPTRQGEEAEYAVQKRELLGTAAGGARWGERPEWYGLGTLQAGAPPHPWCARVDDCVVVSAHRMAMRAGARGTLTCGTEGVAFWLDDGLSCQWRYTDIQSIGVRDGGASRTGGLDLGRGNAFLPPEGTLLGAALNKLVSRTVVNSLVALALNQGTVTFRAIGSSAQSLGPKLAPALRGVARHHRPAG